MLQAAASLAAVSASPDAYAIRLSNTAQIATYGEKAQREVAGYADKILRQARGRDLGDTGSLLSDLMAKAKQLDPEGLQKKGPFAQIFGGVRRSFNRFHAQFETVAGQVDAISDQLQVRLDRMHNDMQMLDGLHAQARAAVAELDAYIAAGQTFAETFRRDELPALSAPSTGDAVQDLLAAQELQDAVLALDRLEKRVHILRQARQIAMQQLPQIRVVQNGDAALVESLSASLTLTIPAWKQKMALILGLERQREALAMQKAVTDTTNALIRRSSEMLKTQALEIEQSSQAGIVDLDLMAKTNAELIETIAGVLQIQTQGHQTRALAEREMARQTQELQAALASTVPA